MQHQLGSAASSTPVHTPAEWRAVVKVLRSSTSHSASSPAHPATRALRAFASLLTDDLVTTLLPSDCSLCRGPLTRVQDSALCSACLDRIQPQTNALCACCGEALAVESVRALGITRYAEQASLCAACRMAPPEFVRAVAYGIYEDELREAIHLLKYDRVRTLAKPLGEMLAAAVETLHGTAANDLLVIPVPLFNAHQRERGFDQSSLIAEEMLRTMRHIHPDWNLQLRHNILQRKRDTRSQFELAPHQRRKNLRGAFTVADKSATAGREVLLIDDIMTTGATARECARVMRAAGAARIWVATVARAQRHDFVAAWNPASSTQNSLH